MNRKKTKEAIKVMQHYVDGGNVRRSYDVAKSPYWNWGDDADAYQIVPNKLKKMKIVAYMDPRDDGEVIFVEEHSRRHHELVTDGWQRVEVEW